MYKFDLPARGSTLHSFIPISNRSANNSLKNKINKMERPLGDLDPNEKIQICIELREVIKKISKKSEFQLEVVILQTKNLLATKDNLTPFVKLRLLPDDILRSTDLKENNEAGNCFYGEPFMFAVDKKRGLQGKTLYVQVCDKKVTRGAFCFGTVTIELEDFEVGKPIINWYHLEK